MKFTLSGILLLICGVCIAQSRFYQRWHLSKSYNHEYHKFVDERIDTIRGDTSKYFANTDKYIEVSKEGVLLIEGYKLGNCGCEPQSNGYWIERYRNGNLKNQGEYECGRKIGRWIYYFENGQIAKIENFKKTYDKFIMSLPDGSDINNPFYRMSLPEGRYLEYYPNGQLKIEGRYKIIEEFSKTDTVSTFDMDTYEETVKVYEGEFWNAKSKKSGVWNSYAENGEVIKHEKYEVVIDTAIGIRDVESRYIERFLQACEKVKKK